MKIQYVDHNFRQSSLDVIEQANAIIEEYQAQGYSLTLRQLYYQMVARDMIENTQRSYKRLGSKLNNARLAGLVNWFAIEDRTRNLKGQPHWSSPASIIESAVSSYQIDKWKHQPFYVEVWIEKDALVSVAKRICDRLDVPYFSCRGYTSSSEMWSAGRRILRKRRGGKAPIILHLGDHDPSGIDMTRDIRERLEMFSEGPVQVERIALNMNQVHQHNPPPNPAKVTDSRSDGYIALYGNESWELDALPPQVLTGLIRENVLSFRDNDLWEEAVARENEEKQALREAADGLNS